MQKQLLLYTTEGCHLCEQARALVAPLLSAEHVQLLAVEISDSDELVERYGIRIPVLRFSDAPEELGWPFDDQAVQAFLATNRNCGEN